MWEAEVTVEVEEGKQKVEEKVVARIEIIGKSISISGSRSRSGKIESRSKSRGKIQK